VDTAPVAAPGFPPVAHDGTERRIVCLQDVAEQTACYSGKKKDHTVKNVLFVSEAIKKPTAGSCRRVQDLYDQEKEVIRPPASWGLIER
jgi:hypothetical protein